MEERGSAPICISASQKDGKNAQVSGDIHRSAKTQANEKDKEWV